MVGYNDSSSYSLDQQLSASVKKVLLQQIVFQDAQIPDKGDILNHKYKPLNGRHNQQQNGNTSKTNQVTKVQDDIPNPPTQIYPADKVELQWKQMRKIGPGLANLGNTCFLNSVLQVLTYTPPLVNYMLSGYHKSKCRIVGFCMQCELSGHINKIMGNNNQMGAIRPMSIIQKLQCIGKNFRFGRQEDAHEFLRYVVEGIQKSDYADKPKLDKLSKETTVANAIFGGFYRSQVKCLHCNYESNTFDPMMDLNMDVKDCSSIIQTLQKSVRPDRLDGENKYFCEKCRTKRVAQKRGNIHKEPNILTLVLKRFDFSKMFGGKISKDVAFPEELNIRPFMSNNHGDPVIYKLYGVLVHSGYSCNSGHYYCYIKALNGTWYEMNDSRVCQVGLQTVLRAQAYILFYLKSNQCKKIISQAPVQNHVTNTANNVEKPVVKQNGLLYTPERKSSLNNAKDSKAVTNDPLGVILKRKPEPKINWMNNDKGNAKGVSLNVSTSSKNTLDNSVRKVDAVVEKQKKDDVKSSLHNIPKISEKETTLNGLQKLSQSYDDSDEVESRSSSPVSDKPSENVKSAGPTEKPQPAECKTKVPDKIEPVKETDDSQKLPSDGNMEQNPRNGSHETRPPFKLTLKNGKQFIHNKLNIWSPITKGTLYPRAILNKCLLDNEGESKLHAKKKKLADSNWKEESISTPEKMFGPLMPPPPGTKCEGSSSITSETSSNGSVQTQSGDWDVLDKGYQVSSPIVPEHKHAGWNIAPSSQDTISSVSGDSQVMSSDFDDTKFKKKKKKKKKHKHKHREEIFTGKVKQQVCISIDQGGKKQELSLGNIDLHDGKKKKVQLQSTISLPLIPLSDTVEIHKKKKKDKERKRKYSLLIDTNTSNLGNVYTIPCSVDKYLSKYKVNSNSDSDSHVKFSKTEKVYSPTKYSSIEKDSIYEKENSPLSNNNQRSSEVNFEKTVKDNDKHTSPFPYKEEKYTSKNGNGPDPSSKAPISSYSRNVATENSAKSTNSSSGSRSSSPKRHEIHNLKENSTGENVTKKKDVPTHVWDDTKKKQFTWDGSNKSDTVEQLLDGGPKVNSWDGSNKSYFYNMKKHSENTQDEWDEEYDKGKVKKKRKLDDDYEKNKSKSNVFQDYQNYKNRNKDNDEHNHNRGSKHHSDDHRHHSNNKKRKLYGHGSRFG